MTQVHEVQLVKAGVGAALGWSGVAAAVSVACVAIPMWVIRPFRPQGAGALELALAVRHAGPWVSGVCVAVVGVVGVSVWGWARVGARVGLVMLFLLAMAGAALTHVNIFERMFHPYDAPFFASADEVKADADDKVLAVRVGDEAKAYPIRTMGYHHIVNDVVGGRPIAVTYCTLCHTGLVWSRVLDGRTLHLRLAGINNGNALLRDEETSSIWQQSTGESVFGPLKGRQLELVRSDELTFGLWRTEQPQGRVLKPEPRYEREYEAKDWERHVMATRTVVDTSQSGVGPHQLMIGVTVEGQSKAYPVETILAAGLLQDRVDGVPVMVVVASDGASIRVFDPKMDGGTVVGFVKDDAGMKDVGTGSEWNFQGCAVSGTLAGRCLKEIDSHKDYWFDWMNHHPGSGIYRG